MLPNLLIIGASKAGTTSLHHYLDQHPDITMAAPNGHLRGGNDDAPKEMRFFWRKDWQTRLAWYESHFEVSTPIRGEATPGYTQHPFLPHVPERIHSLVPDAKLVYIVRDPIDRIVASYVQQYTDGDRRSFAERMSDCERPDHRLVCASRYATQVERYLELFDGSQLHVIDQHDLRHDRETTLRELFGFLGVDPAFRSDAFAAERNARAEKFALTPTGRVLYERVADPVGLRVAPRAWGRVRPRVRRAFSEPVVDRPVVDEALRARLTAVLKPEVERLRDLTGKRFASWSL